MRSLDLAMIVLYALAMLAIGRYYKHRTATADDYLLGGRTMSPFMIGLSLFATLTSTLSYLALPGEMIRGTETSIIGQADELLPRFVVSVLPGGFAGIVIAAMLSAAMSSLSSGVSSSSAVITSDFLGRFRRIPWTPHESMRVARVASLAIGIVAVLTSLFVGQLATNLLELCIKVVNLLTAPIFVLFFLALFVRWATPWGAIAATFASVTTAVGIAFFRWGGLEFLWTAPAALVAGIATGALVSLVTPSLSATTSVHPESKV